MSARKSSHRTIFLIVSSGSPLALIASSLRSTSKKPVCPMTRSFHPPMAIAISESDSQRLGEKNFSRCPYVFCRAEIPIGVCDCCGTKHWNQDAEAIINEVVRREYDKLR